MVLDPKTSLEGMIFILFVGGLGQGVLFSAHQTATQASCAARSATHAITLFSFLRELRILPWSIPRRDHLQEHVTS